MTTRCRPIDERDVDELNPHFERLQLFLDALPTLMTGGALATATAAVSAPMGLATLMCGALLIHGNRADGRFYFGNWSTEWKQTYLESVFPQDPIVQEARRRLSPFTWEELQTDDDFGGVWRETFTKGREHGWVGGFAVPIHGPGGYVGLMSYAGTERRWSASEKAVLVAVAHAAHERGRSLYRPEGDSRLPKLTTRERQVMRWIANGKTDTEIAAILSLSATTVHSYAEQAKRKLGARTRSQAVSEAVLHDLL